MQELPLQRRVKQMEKINQGTIIRGFRSAKYPEVCCYAIVISARCDLANDKISKIYYLTGVDLRQWLSTYHGFHIAYKESISALKSGLSQKFTSDHIQLSVDELLKFSPSDAVLAIEETYKKTYFPTHKDGEEKVIGIRSDFELLCQVFNPQLPAEKRIGFIHKFNQGFVNKKNKTNPAVKFLNEIFKGTTYHYQFIPECAYRETAENTTGILVDLQEICILSLEDAKQIVEGNPGIDFECLDPSDPRTERLLKEYWLTCEDDYVSLQETIKSPWCELLLQRFALDFIRVGVDGATEQEYTSIVNSI